MATQNSTSTLKRADHPTAPLPPFAEGVLRRLELAFAPQVVANFDNYGSLWGYDTVAKTEADIAEERANGTQIDEWDVTDRDGQPLRIVRMADPTFLDTICVFSAWHPYAKTVTA